MELPEMQIRILGPVGVSRAGHEVVLGGSKPRTLLAAMLLSRGWVVPDTRLSELLWGWNPPATMSAQIYTYVSRLRKKLAPEIDMVRHPPGYLLRIRSAEFDFEQFERLVQLGDERLKQGWFEEAARHFRAALDRWQGPALANATEFLAQAERPWLEEARMATLESRVDADLALGRHRHLVAELTRLVAQHPLRERLRVQLMTALYHCDRQTDALAVYYNARRTLAEELGVDPGAALASAYQAVLHGEMQPLPVPRPSGWLPARPERVAVTTPA